MLATVRRDGIEAGGGRWSREDEEAFKAPIRAQYEHAGPPLLRDRAAVGRRHRRPGPDPARARALPLRGAQRRRSPRRASASSGCERARHVHEDPHREPRRDRLPRHPDRAPPRASAPSRSTPRRTRTRRHVRARRRGGRASAPPPARESYLVGDAHHRGGARRPARRPSTPGYGFLSENADFAEACEQAGIVFIGPPRGRDPRHGLEVRGEGAHGEGRASRSRPATTARTRTRPSSRREAKRIGYPVLIKASAGGGGKGMRRVDAPADFDGGARRRASARRPRRSATTACSSSGTCSARATSRSRCSATRTGAASTCSSATARCSAATRRCSRRRPRPGMTPERRAAMGAAAVEAARAVGYVGAGHGRVHRRPDGRVLLHGDEHAAPGRAPGDRDDHRARPRRVAAPRRRRRAAAAAPGAAPHRRPRHRGAHLRRGPGQGLPARPPGGSCTSPRRRPRTTCASTRAWTRATRSRPHYDPMIAKLIVWDATRERALARMRAALAQLRIVGVANNVEFLARLVASPAFASARPRHRPHRARARVPVPGARARRRRRCGSSPRSPSSSAERQRGGAPPARRPRRGTRATAGASTRRASRTLTLRLGEVQQDVTVEYATRRVPARPRRASGCFASGELGGARRVPRADRRAQGPRRGVVAGERRHVFFEGRAYPFVRVDASQGGRAGRRGGTGGSPRRCRAR